MFGSVSQVEKMCLDNVCEINTEFVWYSPWRTTDTMDRRALLGWLPPLKQQSVYCVVA